MCLSAEKIKDTSSERILLLTAGHRNPCSIISGTPSLLKPSLNLGMVMYYEHTRWSAMRSLMTALEKYRIPTTPRTLGLDDGLGYANAHLSSHCIFTSRSSAGPSMAIYTLGKRSRRPQRLLANPTFPKEYRSTLYHAL